MLLVVEPATCGFMRIALCQVGCKMVTLPFAPHLTALERHTTEYCHALIPISRTTLSYDQMAHNFQAGFRVYGQLQLEYCANHLRMMRDLTLSQAISGFC